MKKSPVQLEGVYHLKIGDKSRKSSSFLIFELRLELGLWGSAPCHCQSLVMGQEHLLSAGQSA